MRKTATFLLSLFLLNLYVSCTNKNTTIFQKVNYPTKIKLNPTEVIIEPLKLSEIAKQVEFIPLQTAGGVLLANIGDDIVITDQYFFMRMNASVLKYDKEGRFIKRLFNPGRGPGEVFARSFTVDKNANLVYVYSNYEHVIKVYDFEGILIKTIKKPIDDLSHFTEGIFFFDNSLIVKTYQNQESKYLLSAFDLKTDSIRVLYKDYTHVSTLTKDPKMIQPIDAICYQYLDSIFLFKEMFCDTIKPEKMFWLYRKCKNISKGK